MQGPGTTLSEHTDLAHSVGDVVNASLASDWPRYARGIDTSELEVSYYCVLSDDCFNMPANTGRVLPRRMVHVRLALLYPRLNSTIGIHRQSESTQPFKADRKGSDLVLGQSPTTDIDGGVARR